ncbi:MAG: amidohydrolase family protein, partial [Rhodothermales bacterium]
LREAKRRERIQTLYAENPTGMERPVFDPVHEALYSVADGEKPLFVLADGLDSALEVHRALQLREELGFSLALAGLHQGFDVADDLRGQSIPLFLALGLPRAEIDTTSAKLFVADTLAVDTTDVIAPEQTLRLTGDLRTETYEEIDVERENLSIRQNMERQRYYGTAARFRDAGLSFGVTTIGSLPDKIREHLHKMIEAGLPEDAALAALTVDGARLLGIDRMVGTVEAGKLANLVVTKGSYFDPKSPVQYVFVYGEKFEITPAKRAKPSIAGVWQIGVETGDGTVPATVTIRDEGGALSGEIESSQLQAPSTLEDVVLSAGRLTFTFRTSEYGRITARLVVSGDSMSGTMAVPGEGNFNITGSKSPK